MATISNITISPDAEQAIEKWLYYISREETEETLQSLELKTEGNLFAKHERLYKWLAGEYSQQDFQESTTPHDEMATRRRRVEKRSTYVEKTILDRSKSTIADDAGQEISDHLLAVLTADPAISIRIQGLLSDEPDTTRQATPLLDQLSMADLVEAMKALQAQNKVLSDSLIAISKRVDSLANPKASSTRINDHSSQHLDETPVPTNTGGRRQNVNFQDTFAIIGNNNSSSPVHDRLAPQSRVPSEVQTGSSTGTHNNPSSVPTPAPRTQDVGHIVRRWNVHFSGAKGECIELFLTRVEECRALAKLSESDLVSSLSELLRGVAATWFRNHKNSWKTWAEFQEAARRWYGTNRRFQQRLAAEANARTQGRDEPVRDYITCLQSIIMKQVPLPAIGQQLDLLHRNLLPDIQRIVRRDEIIDIESLLDRAVEAELTLEAGQVYRPPPAPENSLLPDVAYKPPNSKEAKTQVAAVHDKQAATEQTSLARLVSQMLQEMKQMRASFDRSVSQQQNRRRSPPSPPSNRRNFSKGRQFNRQPNNNNNNNGSNKRGPSRSPPRKDNKPSTSKSADNAETSNTENKNLKCYGCGLPGYTVATCPKCPGKGTGNK